jgi:hypothetical protein
MKFAYGILLPRDLTAIRDCRHKVTANVIAGPVGRVVGAVSSGRTASEDVATPFVGDRGVCRAKYRQKTDIADVHGDAR